MKNQPLIQDVNKNILNLKGDIGDLKAKLVETGVDVGPAIYIARTFDTDVDTVVKFFIFILIFVFDPMAVMFVISYNVTLLDKNVKLKEHEKVVRKSKKSWWEVYGEEKKKEIKDNMHKTIKQDKRFDKAEEPIDKPDLEDIPKLEKGGFSRKKHK